MSLRGGSGKADKALTAMLTAPGRRGGLLSSSPIPPPGKKAGVTSEASRPSQASTGLEVGRAVLACSTSRDR